MECRELKQPPRSENRTEIPDQTSCKFNEYMKRSEFSRDRDRILFSKAFRRLQHKGQVYSFEEGDHFRTRLTHTLEVTVIAKTLSNALEVDVDLTEAIALGHDIGHAPFGHQGERTLDQIMKGYDPLEGRNIIKTPIDYRGFKHNYNSVRILYSAEKKDENTDGLNLTWQVLEGIFKHTRIHRNKQELSEGYGDWVELLTNDSELRKKLHIDNDDSVSIEGQIVAIADEIAQRQHDLDDGLRDQSSGLLIKELYNEIIAETDRLILNYKKKQDEDSEEQDLSKYLETMETLNKTLRSKKGSKDIKYKSSCLQKYIIKYFLTDVVATTKSNVEVLKNTEYEKIDGVPIIKKKVVSFSKIGDDFNENINKIITKRILNSFKINKFDGKSQYIVRRLFKAYYVNPLQMHGDVLKKIEDAIKMNSSIYPIKLQNAKEKTLRLDEINFKDSSNEEINVLIETLKLENIKKNLQTPSDFDDNCFKSATSEEIIYCIRNLKSNNINNDDQISIEVIKNEYQETNRFKSCLLANNYAFLSTICYHISGMTDSYAKQQFKELYL